MTGYLDPGLVRDAVAQSSLEWKLTNEHAFALTTATPLQRAICRIADGAPLGELADRKDVRDAIGDVSALEPGHRPREVCLLSAIRTAKSLMAACAGVHMALTVDLAGMRPGEIPRIPIVSLQKDLAEVIVGHLAGTLTTSRLLRPFLLEQPNSEGVLLRHPSGTPVEIKVVAGARAGATLVARWMAGCIFDEFPRMVGGDEGVVNWHDQRNAILLRIRPGCQIWHIGSPHAPYGPAYDLVTTHHGKAKRDMVVVKAPGAPMNPSWWTPEEIERYRTDPETAAAYKTDCLAEFATAEESMFSAASIDACTRSEPLVRQREEGHTYFAAMDPATRGNGWTLAIATKDYRGRVVVVRADEWQGSRDEPLDPGAVLEEVASIVIPYGITAIMSDQVMGDALQALARKVGLHLVQQQFVERERAKKYLTIRTNLDRKMVELPPIRRMRTDLLHVQKRATPTGIGVKLPMTGDGRHCDWAPTLMLVLSRLLPDPDAPGEGPPRPGDDAETKKVLAQLKASLRKDTW